MLVFPHLKCLRVQDNLQLPWHICGIVFHKITRSCNTSQKKRTHNNPSSVKENIFVLNFYWTINEKKIELLFWSLKRDQTTNKGKMLSTYLSIIELLSEWFILTNKKNRWNRKLWFNTAFYIWHTLLEPLFQPDLINQSCFSLISFRYWGQEISSNLSASPPFVCQSCSVLSLACMVQLTRPSSCQHSPAAL